jgi:hypothetical protein
LKIFDTIFLYFLTVSESTITNSTENFTASSDLQRKRKFSKSPKSQIANRQKDNEALWDFEVSGHVKIHVQISNSNYQKYFRTGKMRKLFACGMRMVVVELFPPIFMYVPPMFIFKRSLSQLYKYNGFDIDSTDGESYCWLIDELQ